MMEGLGQPALLSTLRPRHSMGALSAAGAVSQTP